MDKFFEASLPEDLIVFIRKNLKDNCCGDSSYVYFPANYRSKLEKLLPEIVKYYGAKGWNVELDTKVPWARNMVGLHFSAARPGTLYL